MTVLYITSFPRNKDLKKMLINRKNKLELDINNLNKEEKKQVLEIIMNIKKTLKDLE